MRQMATAAGGDFNEREIAVVRAASGARRTRNRGAKEPTFEIVCVIFHLKAPDVARLHALQARMRWMRTLASQECSSRLYYLNGRPEALTYTAALLISSNIALKWSC